MGWFVEYYVFDPVDERMIRKRIRIQKLIKRYRTKREQAIAAQQIAEELNHKLAGGWSPLHESDDSRPILLLTYCATDSSKLRSARAAGIRRWLTIRR